LHKRLAENTTTPFVQSHPEDPDFIGTGSFQHLDFLSCWSRQSRDSASNSYI